MHVETDVHTFIGTKSHSDKTYVRQQVDRDQGYIGREDRGGGNSRVSMWVDFY